MKGKFSRKTIGEFGRATSMFFIAAKKGDTFTGRFSYSMTKVSKGIKSELEALDAYDKVHLKDYTTERNKLLDELTKKDETTGKAIGQNGYVVLVDAEVSQQKLAALDEKYKEVLDAQKKFLDETVEIEIWRIELDELNQPKINPIIVQLLEPLIVEKLPDINL